MAKYEIHGYIQGPRLNTGSATKYGILGSLFHFGNKLEGARCARADACTLYSTKTPLNTLKITKTLKNTLTLRKGLLLINAGAFFALVAVGTAVSAFTKDWAPYGDAPVANAFYYTVMPCSLAPAH